MRSQPQIIRSQRSCGLFLYSWPCFHSFCPVFIFAWDDGVLGRWRCLELCFFMRLADSLLQALLELRRCQEALAGQVPVNWRQLDRPRPTTYKPRRRCHHQTKPIHCRRIDTMMASRNSLEPAPLGAISSTFAVHVSHQRWRQIATFVGGWVIFIVLFTYDLHGFSNALID